MEHAPTVNLRNVLGTADYVGGTIAMIVNLVALLVLLGFIGVLVYGAFSQRQLVTSWSPQEEQTFRPHESYMGASHSKAWLISLVTASVFGIFVIGVYFGVAPVVKDYGKTMNMDNLTKKSSTKPAESAPAATPDKPAAEKPAAAPPAEKPADPPAEKK